MLEVENLCKSFYSGFMKSNRTDAVKNVSFKIEDGEIFGIIGGSGCGKTTTSRMIMGLLKPDSGRIRYNGLELTELTRRQWKPMRREIQMVFQNPQMTFNPRATVYNCCAEPIRIFGLADTKQQEEAMVREMLEVTGVLEDQKNKFPHEISGGQAQRISIIRALCLDPKLLICDEPTSMLDVSVQAQIIEMLLEYQKKNGLSMLYISHNLDVMKSVCHRIAVMNCGEIVEIGTVEQIYNSPKSEFTRQLMDSAI